MLRTRSIDIWSLESGKVVQHELNNTYKARTLIMEKRRVANIQWLSGGRGWPLNGTAMGTGSGSPNRSLARRTPRTESRLEAWRLRLTRCSNSGIWRGAGARQQRCRRSCTNRTSIEGSANRNSMPTAAGSCSGTPSHWSRTPTRSSCPPNRSQAHAPPSSIFRDGRQRVVSCRSPIESVSITRRTRSCGTPSRTTRCRSC
jgi:hypothetical protein